MRLGAGLPEAEGEKRPEPVGGARVAVTEAEPEWVRVAVGVRLKVGEPEGDLLTLGQGVTDLAWVGDTEAEEQRVTEALLEAQALLEALSETLGVAQGEAEALREGEALDVTQGEPVASTVREALRHTVDVAVLLGLTVAAALAVDTRLGVLFPVAEAQLVAERVPTAEAVSQRLGRRRRSWRRRSR